MLGRSAGGRVRGDRRAAERAAGSDLVRDPAAGAADRRRARQRSRVGGAITLAGRVEAFCADPMSCSGTTIAATITVTRPSRFAGGPGFSAVATASDGVARGTDSFSIAVPPTQGRRRAIHDHDRAGGHRRRTAEQRHDVAGRARAAAPHDDDRDDRYRARHAHARLRELAGDQRHADRRAATPLTKYRVVALGHLGDASAPLSEVSTVDYTTTGTYSVTLADCDGIASCEGIVGTVSIEAAPYDATVTAPTLYAGPCSPCRRSRRCRNPLRWATRSRSRSRSKARQPGAVDAGRRRARDRDEHVPAGRRHSAARCSRPTSRPATTASRRDALDGDAFATATRIEVIPPAGSAARRLRQAARRSTARRSGCPSASHSAARSSTAPATASANISVTAAPSLRFQWSLDRDGQSLAGRRSRRRRP